MVLRLDVNILTNMRYYVYKLTFESGATYIGQHTEKVDNDGYVSSSVYMQRHPEDKLVNREILIEVKDKETLDIMETLCIRADKCSNPKNVNGTMGNWYFRFTFLGCKHSEKKKKDTSEFFKQKWSEKDFRNEMIAKRTGRKNTEETKELMSSSAKSSWTEDRKRKAKESGNYSHPHNEETKKFLSESKIGLICINNGIKEKFVKNPNEYIKNGWIKGKLKVSDETRKRMSESAKKRPCNTAGKKKIHKGDIGKFVSIEELQKYLDDGWELGVSEKRKDFLRKLNKK